MTIAVTGATGQLGRLAIAALKARAPQERIVALVRSPEKAADLGVEARVFDYDRPETLGPGLRGVDVLVLISSNDFTDRAGQHRRVIEAAKPAGVGRIVYTSILKGADSPLLLAADHAATEAALRESGLAHTILRNGWYVENYTGSLGAALAAGAIVGAAGQARLSTAARADYAEAIAVVAVEAGHENAVYELGGDPAHTIAELATEVSRQTGRDIPYRSLPEGEYAALLQTFGLPEGFARAIADADARAESHDALLDESGTLARLIGRPATPLAQSVAAALSQG